MHPEQPTLHSTTVALWRDLPLPLAELGTQIRPDSPDYLRSLFALTEALLCTALAVGLSRARRREDWPAHAGQAATHFVTASLGTRVSLVEYLDKLVPGACGWDLTAPLSGCDALLGATGAALGRRAPTVRDVLGAVVVARNIPAHPSGGRDAGPSLTSMWEDSIVALLRANGSMHAPLLWMSEVQVQPGGSRAYRAHSLSGPFATPYRRGALQPTSQPVEPRLVYVGSREGQLEPLWPFLVSDDGERAFVLSGLKRRPQLWRPAQAELYETDLSAAYDEALPGWRAAKSVADRADSRASAGAHTVPDPGSVGPSSPQASDSTALRAAPPAPVADPAPTRMERGVLAASAPRPEAPRRAGLAPPVAVPHRAQLLLFALAGFLALLALTGIATIAVVWPTGPEPPSRVPAGSSPSTAATATRSTSPTTVTGSPAGISGPRASGPIDARGALPHLTGMDLRFSDAVAAADGRYPEMAQPYVQPCAADILTWRQTAGRGTPIPRGTVKLAFHPTQGLFEALVTTDAPVDEVVRLLESRIAGAFVVPGQHWERRWSFPDGRGAVGLRVRQAQRGADTVVKVWDIDRSDVYWTEARQRCPQLR